MMIRNGEIYTLIESKLMNFKVCLLMKLKNYSLQKWKIKWKNYSLKNLKKNQNWNQQRDGRVKVNFRSMLKIWSFQMRNSKKNAKNINNTVDVYV